MAINTFKKEISVKQLGKMAKNSELRFDLAIQRNEVWDNARQSLFIHSLIYGFPFPPVYALDKGDSVLWFLDGKQRLTTTLKFIEDGFLLHEDVPMIGDEDIAGKAFSELDEEMQDKIMDSMFLIYQFRNMTEDEVDEMFYRLNNGMALTTMELTRVLASSKIMSYVQSISKTKFFDEVIAVTEKSKNRFVDEELILQILAIVMSDGAVDIGGKDLKKFAEKTEEIPEETKEVVSKTAGYLSEAVPDKMREMKKVHIPMVFMMAIKAQEKGILPEKFGGWVQSFFTRLKDKKHADYRSLATYRSATQSGTGKKDKVNIRLVEMEKDFLLNVEKSSDYKKPEETTSTRSARAEQKAKKEAEEKAKKEAEEKAKAEEEQQEQETQAV